MQIGEAAASSTQRDADSASSDDEADAELVFDLDGAWLPDDAVIRFEGLRAELRLDARTCHRGGGHYVFVLRGLVQGANTSGVLTLRDGDHVLFEGVDLYAIASALRANEPADAVPMRWPDCVFELPDAEPARHGGGGSPFAPSEESFGRDVEASQVQRVVPPSEVVLAGGSGSEFAADN